MDKFNLTLHIITKELSDKSLNSLEEECLRAVHKHLIDTKEKSKLRTIVLSSYLTTTTSGIPSDIKLTYQLASVEGKPKVLLYDVFLGDNIITALLSQKAISDLVYEAEAILDREKSYNIDSWN